MPNQSIYDIPFGAANLAAMFSGVDFRFGVADYFVEVLDQNGNVMATSPLATMQACSPDRIRIFFLNYLGRFDGVDFMDSTIQHETTNSTFKRPLPIPFAKTDAGSGRTNIVANDTYTVMTTAYGEADMAWLLELADASKAFIQWTGTEGQPNSYLPITIHQGKYIRKSGIGDRWVYEFTLEFELSNDRVLLRN